MMIKSSKRTHDSLVLAGGGIGLVSTVSSIIGYSLHDLLPEASIIISVLVVAAAFIALFVILYLIIGRVYKEKVKLTINDTSVEICCGDIFHTEGLRVIGCDTRFDTRVDDTVISRTSLHGRFVLEHGDIPTIEKTVKNAAQRLNLPQDEVGQYTFPLGSIVKYEKDSEVFLLLAMTELNRDFESHTNMIQFEQMLMKMWKEISRVYNGSPVAIPLLGTGMTRFDDGIKDSSTLLRCMLCTMHASGVKLKTVRIVIPDNQGNIPLYEFKDILRIIPGLSK